jgi:hypothetical protein
MPLLTGVNEMVKIHGTKPKNGYFVTVENSNTGNCLEIHGPYDSANEADAARIKVANTNEQWKYCLVDFAWYGPNVEPTA